MMVQTGRRTSWVECPGKAWFRQILKDQQLGGLLIFGLVVPVRKSLFFRDLGAERKHLVT